MYTLFLIAQSLVLVLAISTGFAYLTLMERRLLARFQNRVGPNRAGPYGILQPAADAAKLFFKEDVIPLQADRWVYLLAPIIAVVTALVIWVVIPFGCWNIAGTYHACFTNPADPAIADQFWNVLQMTDFAVSVFYIVAITSIGVYAITLAGWSSNSKYAMLGGIRSSAQLISYELSFGLAILGAIMTAGTLSVREIVYLQHQEMWLVIPQLLGFTLFCIGGLAELGRSPFDLVEAEQELTCGYNTEYSSMKFALFFMAEYIKLIAISAIAVTLYLGGWSAPGLEWFGHTVAGMAGDSVATVAVGIASLIIFVVKVAIMLFISIWIRASWPRIRYDRLMEIGWKWLLPVALANVAMTAVIIVLVPDNVMTQNLLMFATSVILLAVLLVGLKPGRKAPPPNHIRMFTAPPRNAQESR